MSQLKDILSTVSVDSDWQPDHQTLMDLFKASAKSIFCDNNSYYTRGERGNEFAILMNPNALAWTWNNFYDNRGSIFELYCRYYTWSDYYSPKFKNGIGAENKEFIKGILTDVWNKLPDDSDSVEIKQAKVNISTLLDDPNFEIDYTKRLTQAYIENNKENVRFWTDSGLARSKDSDFYSMVWSRIERSKGYTDKRDHIISSAEKCSVFPEDIISELVSSGHAKNKQSVVRIFTRRIEETKRLSLPDEMITERIAYPQSVIGKFASCEDYGVQQMILPHLKRQDLMFAAPVASKLGLNRLVEQCIARKDGDYSDWKGRYRY